MLFRCPCRNPRELIVQKCGGSGRSQDEAGEVPRFTWQLVKMSLSLNRPLCMLMISWENALNEPRFLIFVLGYTATPQVKMGACSEKLAVC